VRDEILATFPDLTGDDVRSVSMGASGCDILLSPLAKKRFPYSVECKNLARVAIYSLFEQSVSNTANNTRPLLVIKQNRSEPLVVLTLKDFMDLIKENKNPPPTT
jgi:hypothetical protein